MSTNKEIHFIKNLDEIKSRIDPAYQDQLGTESHERKFLTDCIDGLLAENKRMREALEAWAQADRYSATADGEGVVEAIADSYAAATSLRDAALSAAPQPPTAEASSDKDILRRIAERGLKLAQNKGPEFIDLWQHMLDEIQRQPTADAIAQAVEQDAARYRWIVENKLVPWGAFLDSAFAIENGIDAAIDAARREGGAA